MAHLDPQQFQDFRKTGELSDLTVVLGEQEFKLHRFPLYTRSAYIKAFIRDQKDDEPTKVTFETFPGGPEIFELVADFCYGINIQITSENVVALRCGADLLEMEGPGNLIAQTDGYIKDLLSSARLTRNVDKIIKVLQTSFELGPCTDKLELDEKCVEALTEIWIRGHSRFNPSSSEYFSYGDISLQDKLLDLPKEFFIQLLTKARDVGAKSTLWGSLIQTYITRKHSDTIKRKQQERAQKKAEERKAKEKDTESNKTKDEQKNDENEGNQDDREQKPAEEESGPKENGDGGQSSSEDEDAADDKASKSSSQLDEEQQKEYAQILDEVFNELPDNLPLADGVSPIWVVDSLGVASKHDCACREKLLNVACQVLPKLPESEISKFEPTEMSELAEKLSALESTDKSAITGVCDKYLVDKVREGFEDVDVILRIVASTNKDDRTEPDNLFEVIETLSKKKSEDDKPCLTDEQTNTLFAGINFSQLSEEALQRAHEAKIVPEQYITEAALAMCTQLRTQLDTARSIIKMQEEELQKRRYPATYTPNYTPTYSKPSYSRQPTSYTRTTKHTYGTDEFSTNQNSGMEAGEDANNGRDHSDLSPTYNSVTSTNTPSNSSLHTSLPYWEYYSPREYAHLVDDMDLYDEPPTDVGYRNYDYGYSSLATGSYRLDLGDDYITRRLHWSLSGK